MEKYENDKNDFLQTQRIGQRISVCTVNYFRAPRISRKN